MSLNFEAMPKFIAIVGSREFPLDGQVKRFVDKLPIDTTILSGGAKGPDSVAERAAVKRGMPEPIIFRPRQDVIDKIGYVPALLARNTEIVLEAKARDGLVVAFVLTPPRTGGTDDTLTKCDKNGVPYIKFRMTQSGEWLSTQTNQAFQKHKVFRNLLVE